MGKLIVEKLNQLKYLKKTQFYRIIGTVLEYNYERGVITIASLYDDSSCEIELDMESVHRQEDNFYEGYVVDAEVVTTITGIDRTLKCTLKARDITNINLPRSLIEYKETLRGFASIERIL